MVAKNRQNGKTKIKMAAALKLKAVWSLNETFMQFYLRWRYQVHFILSKWLRAYKGELMSSQIFLSSTTKPHVDPFSIMSIAIETHNFWVRGRVELRAESLSCHLIITVIPTLRERGIRLSEICARKITL